MTELDMPLYKEIGIILKNARESKKISYDTLVNAIGGHKTKSTLKRYENGLSRMEMETLEKICIALGLNIDEVIITAKAKTQESKSQWGNHEANLDYLEDKPELKAIYKEIVNRDDIYVLFDKTKDLDPKDVESVLMFVQTIRKQRGMDE
jgi:repressor LexA